MPHKETEPGAKAVQVSGGQIGVEVSFIEFLIYAALFIVLIIMAATGKLK